jgi:hypothetical protein
MAKDSSAMKRRDQPLAAASKNACVSSSGIVTLRSRGRFSRREKRFQPHFIAADEGAQSAQSARADPPRNP